MSVNQKFGTVTSSLTFDIFILAVLFTGAGLATFQSAPKFDELYHILAARSWVQDGSFSIADGSYTRAAAFTALLGTVFVAVGESFQTAKLLPLTAAVLLVLAVFLWVRTEYGRAAAWITALLFGFSPGALEIAQFVRFYSLHALALWIFVASIYSALTATHSLPKLVLLLIVALSSWALAYHLQDTSLIATVGLGLWICAVYGPKLLARILALPRGNLILVGLVVLALVAAAGLAALNVYAELWQRLRFTAPWQYDRRDESLFYHIYLVRSFPSLWSLFPLAALLAIRRNVQAGLLCTSIVLVAVLLHSLAGPKSYRYLHYAMPFFFVIWGAALVEIMPYIYRLAAAAAARLSEEAPFYRRIKPLVTLGAIVAVVVFVVASNTAYTKSAAMLIFGAPEGNRNAEGWRAAKKVLQPLIDEAEIIATSNGLFALYYLGRYEVDISPSQVAESSTGEEFGRDLRTGRVTISTPESLDLLMSCHESGLFIGDAVWRWRTPNVGVSDEVADFLVSRSETIEVPKHWMLRVYRWQRPEGSSKPEDCPDLHGLTSVANEGGHGSAGPKDGQCPEEVDPS